VNWATSYSAIGHSPFGSEKEIVHGRNGKTRKKDDLAYRSAGGSEIAMPAEHSSHGISGRS
jgi:hypothetical protein